MGAGNAAIPEAVCNGQRVVTGLVVYDQRQNRYELRVDFRVSLKGRMARREVERRKFGPRRSLAAEIAASRATEVHTA